MALIPQIPSLPALNPPKASWRDALRPASFRGVEFEVETNDYSTGRRGPTHEYPGRDKPYFEDLGRATREIRVDGFVVGDDYFAKRDALLGAIETKGAGQLVHPTFGTISVVCLTATVRESVDDGRMARISMSFIEAGELTFPTGSADGRSNIEAKSALAKIAALDSFQAIYAATGFQEFVTQSVIPMGERFAASILGSLSSGPLRDFVSDFVDNLPTLVNSASGLSAQVLTLIEGLRTGVTSNPETILRGDARPAGLLTTLSDLSVFDSDVPDIPRETSGRVQEEANMESFAGLIRKLSMIEAARELAVTEFDSNAAASGAMSDWSSLVDTELYSPIISDQEYASMSDLHSATVSDLATRAGGLPSIIYATPQQTTPALVLAYERYDDANRDTDIVARNSIKHPGFVPGGVEIEVLST